MLLAIILLLSKVSSLVFVVTNSAPICLQVDGGAWNDIQYIVSGPNENLINFTIYHKQQALLAVTQKAEFKGKHQLPLGQVQFCFTTIDGYSKSVSLYFAQEYSNEIQTKKQRTKNAIAQIVKAIGQVQTVYRNQHYQMQRDNQHKTILQNVQLKVKWGGVIKILVLLLAGFLQFWILKRYIQNPPKVYSQVSSR